jgi:glycosyltransferase involved in cell wall biosynthesis
MKLFIIPSWYPSRLHPESGSFFRDMALLLQKAGHDVTVITYLIHSAREAFRFGTRLKSHSQPQQEGSLRVYREETVNRFPKFQKRAYAWYQPRLIRLLEQALGQEGRPDLVLIHSSLWAGAALGPCLTQKSIPFFTTEHLKEFLPPGGFTLFQKECIQSAYRSAAGVLVPSPALAEGITAQFQVPPQRLHIVPNPVDTEVFQPGKESTSSPFTFITIALLRPEKRLDILLKACADVIGKGHAIRLTVVGKGPEEQRLRKLAQDLKVTPHVEFVGYQDQREVVKLLQASHALVLSSEMETFGMVLVEAMACGKPVIATRCGGPEYIVTSETGLLVPVNDPKALDAAMKSMLNNYDRFQPQVIREYVESRFSGRAYAQHIESLFQSLEGN